MKTNLGSALLACGFIDERASRGHFLNWEVLFLRINCFYSGSSSTPQSSGPFLARDYPSPRFISPIKIARKFVFYLGVIRLRYVSVMVSSHLPHKFAFQYCPSSYASLIDTTLYFCGATVISTKRFLWNTRMSPAWLLIIDLLNCNFHGG